MSNGANATGESVGTQVVNVGGLETTLRRGGSGKPLLYLAGQGHPSQWIPLYDRLAERFDVIVPEHPGVGATELPNFIRDFNDLSVHYAQLLDALALGPVHLVGHSFGGWVAAELAALYPERIRSLTLIAPHGMLPDEQDTMPDTFRLNREQYLDRALGEDRERWAAYTDAESDPAEQMLVDYAERMAVARVAWNPRYSLRLEQRLQRVQAPAQVIVPDQDELTAPSVARRYAELLPDATLTDISGEGAPTRHLLVLQEPERVAGLVAALAASAS